MTRQTTRRDMIKESVALAGLGVLGLPRPFLFAPHTRRRTLAGGESEDSDGRVMR